MFLGNLKQNIFTITKPFARQLGVLPTVARSAGKDDVRGVTSAAFRNGDYMIGRIFITHFTPAIKALAVLLIVFSSQIFTGVMTTILFQSFPSFENVSPGLIGVVTSVFSFVPFYFFWVSFFPKSKLFKATFAISLVKVATVFPGFLYILEIFIVKFFIKSFFIGITPSFSRCISLFSMGSSTFIFRNPLARFAIRTPMTFIFSFLPKEVVSINFKSLFTTRTFFKPVNNLAHFVTPRNEKPLCTTTQLLRSNRRKAANRIYRIIPDLSIPIRPKHLNYTIVKV